MSASSLAPPDTTTTLQKEEQQPHLQGKPLVLEDLGKTVDEDNNGRCVSCLMVGHH